MNVAASELSASPSPYIRPVPAAMKKPGYAAVCGNEGLGKTSYYSYEELYLYPSVRKGILFSLSVDPGLRACCACSARTDLPLRIRDDLSVTETVEGHDPSCSAYRKRLKDAITSGYLWKMCCRPKALDVSFSWGKGARNKIKGAFYPGTAAGLIGTALPDLSLFAGTVATMSYNKNIRRLLSSGNVPAPADVISSLMMEFSRYTVKSKSGKELPLSSSFYVPWGKDVWGVSFVVGRLLRSELVGRSEKFVALSVETVLPSTFAADRRPSRFTVDSELWRGLMGLSHIEMYMPGEFEGKGIYLVGICANVEVKVRSAGVYDSFTRSSYGAEDRSFLAKRLQTFSLLRLNDYGMPCANDAEKRISESYTCAGYTCSKRLLPLPDSSLPAFVVENDRGTARAVNYSELSG